MPRCTAVDQARSSTPAPSYFPSSTGAGDGRLEARQPRATLASRTGGFEAIDVLSVTQAQTRES